MSNKDVRHTNNTTPTVVNTTIYFNSQTSLATYAHDDIEIHSLACMPQLMNITDFFEVEIFDEIYDWNYHCLMGFYAIIADSGTLC